MFLQDRILEEALTFDDVLLIPSFSKINPSEVSLKTFLTSEIILNVPIISAAMDTVTESSLAKAIAKEGGLGFIHKNMTIEEQAEKVDKVKRSENGMIDDPITLSRYSNLENAYTLMKHYGISGLPVIEKDRTLVGIITNRDIKYRNDTDTLVEDVMTKEGLVTSGKGTTLEKAKGILLNSRIEKLPIVDKKNKLIGLITIKDIDSLIEYPYACKDNRGRLRVGAAVGISIDTMKRVQRLVNVGVDIITLDSAHGHSIGAINTLKEIRNCFPKLAIVGGNIVTAQAAKDLIDAGANILKIGIGPGSICTTRIVTGVGMPQLTAISNIYQYTRKKNIKLISDGGIKFSGDIVKAIAAGSDCVMIGSLLAGTDEAPGEEIIYQGRKFKTYVGMGSIAAMKRGSKDRYFQTNIQKLVPEGIEARVPYKGSVKDVIYQLCGGLRSGMGYCGTPTINDLMKNANFVKITKSGLRESHPHDVTITKESPNYYN